MTVPRAAAAAIARALAKDPAERFETTAQFGAALGDDAGIVGGGLARLEEPPGATIVVLPFEDGSPGAEGAFFAIGLTDETISDLSEVKAIRVISRNSSMKLRGTTKDLKTIGRELAVRYVLTGSVRRAGDALRITAELVDTQTDTPVWSENGMPIPRPAPVGSGRSAHQTSPRLIVADAITTPREAGPGLGRLPAPVPGGLPPRRQRHRADR